MPTSGVLRLLALVLLAVGSATAAGAQQPEPQTREAVIEQEQADKVKTLHPYEPTTFERTMNKAESILTNGALHWHPFFDSAYNGGGFAFGAGYIKPLSAYNMLDVRASYTISGYTRAEAEFTAPRLFHRRGALSVLGGWREATQVGFYGLGPNSSVDNRTNYDFQQPYASALLTVKPTRRFLTLIGGVEFSQWSQRPGEGSVPSVETVYTPATLLGLGAQPTYLHSQGTFGFDWRTSPDYSRRGGFYGVTVHDYTDQDAQFGFRRVDYTVIEHFPILREAWVISLRGQVDTTFDKSGQQIPFFMLPSLGGGSNLRGYSSWRFRDRNRLLLQAEWRIMVNRFIDTAFFYDAGTVAARAADLGFNDLKSDYGAGVRFHGPFTTPLRVDLAKSSEKWNLVFSTSAVF
jgi:surface antigen Omp85-like protein